MANTLIALEVFQPLPSWKDMGNLRDLGWLCGSLPFQTFNLLGTNSPLPYATIFFGYNLHAYGNQFLHQSPLIPPDSGIVHNHSDIVGLSFDPRSKYGSPIAAPYIGQPLIDDLLWLKETYSVLVRQAAGKIDFYPFLPTFDQSENAQLDGLVADAIHQIVFGPERQDITPGYLQRDLSFGLG